jgi:hypothetical protein
VRAKLIRRSFKVWRSRLLSGSEWKTAILFFAVPIREGFTRLISSFDVLSPHPMTPDWVVHIINQK